MSSLSVKLKQIQNLESSVDFQLLLDIGLDLSPNQMPADSGLLEVHLDLKFENKFLRWPKTEPGA